MMAKNGNAVIIIVVVRLHYPSTTFLSGGELYFFILSACFGYTGKSWAGKMWLADDDFFMKGN